MRKLTGLSANRIYDKAYANGFYKGLHDGELLKLFLLSELRQAMNEMADLIVTIGAFEGVIINSENLIKMSTSDSPIGRIRNLIISHGDNKKV